MASVLLCPCISIPSRLEYSKEESTGPTRYLETLTLPKGNRSQVHLLVSL